MCKSVATPTLDTGISEMSGDSDGQLTVYNVRLLLLIINININNNINNINNNINIRNSDGQLTLSNVRLLSLVSLSNRAGAATSVLHIQQCY